MDNQLVQGQSNSTVYTKQKNESCRYTFLDSCIQLFAFISILLIGADKWGIDIGINLRLDQVFLCVLALLIFLKNGFRLTFNLWIVLFLLFTFFSTLFAVSLFRGVLFYCSIVYNVIFVFYLFSNYVKLYGLSKFLHLFRLSLYWQFVILVLQYVLKTVLNYELPILPSYGEYGGVFRFNLWFYEPSYLATYLSFWFTLSLYMLLIGRDKSYWKDILMGLSMFLISTSTTGFVSIALACIIVYFIWILKCFTPQKLIFPVIVLFGLLIFRLAFPNIFEVYVGRLFDRSLNDASGGRIAGWAETWDVFCQNPLFGVGPGNYGLYLSGNAELVPSNVTLELMATVGILATIAFYGLTVSLFVKAVKLNRKLHNQISIILVGCSVALIVFTIILQVNQGYLRLYHWMFFGFINGSLEYQAHRGSYK